MLHRTSLAHPEYRVSFVFCISGGAMLNNKILNTIDAKAKFDQTLKQALELLKEAQEYEAVFSNGHSSITAGMRKFGIGFNGDNLCTLKKLILNESNTLAWTNVIESSSAATILNQAAYSSLKSDIAKGNRPDFNLSNVESTLCSLYDTKEKLFIEGVVSVFEKTARSYLKSQSSFKLTNKIILTNVYDVCRFFGGVTNFLDEAKRYISDIERYCNIVTGNSRSSINKVSELLRSGVEFGSLYGTSHFKVRFHKSGSIHLTFNSPATMDRLNEVIAHYYCGSLPNESWFRSI